MTISNGAVTIAVTEVAIYANVGSSPATVKVSNGAAGQAVYIGATGLAVADGWTLASDTTESFPLPAGNTLYGIVAGTTQVVKFVATQN